MKATSHTETGENMHVYEVGYIVAPSVGEAALPEQVKALRSLIERAGGEVIAEGFPELQDLAYEIEKKTEAGNQSYTEGYFGWIKFDMLASAVVALEKEITALPHLVRFILVKTLRENTMFEPKQVGAADIADAKKGDKMEDETVSSDVAPVDVVEKEEKKETSREDIDKSIDALVIS